MRIVSWFDRNGNPVQHSIYTQKEARDLKITFFPNWRDSSGKGCWILTDDGFIVQVLAQGEFKTKQRWLRTCTGCFQIKDSQTCDTAERENRYTLNGKKPSVHQTITVRTKEFARLYAMGMNPIKAYTQAFPTVNPRWAKQNVNVLLKKKEVQALVRKELKGALEKLGISDEYILKGFKGIADDTTAIDTSKLSALNSLAKIAGMMDQKKESSTSQVFLGIDPVELQNLRAGSSTEIKPVSSVEIPEEIEPEDMEGDFNE